MVQGWVRGWVQERERERERERETVGGDKQCSCLPVRLCFDAGADVDAVVWPGCTSLPLPFSGLRDPSGILSEAIAVLGWSREDSTDPRMVGELSLIHI